MALDLENSLAFKVASRLRLQGSEAPNGYTGPILRALRRLQKSAAPAADVCAALR
jgi:malate synthase